MKRTLVTTGTSNECSIVTLGPRALHVFTRYVRPDSHQARQEKVQHGSHLATGVHQMYMQVPRANYESLGLCVGVRLERV